MSSPRANRSRSRGQSSRSKLYERYNVEIERSSPPRAGGRRWFNEKEGPSASRQDLPIQERNNAELCRIILRGVSWRSRLAVLAAAVLLAAAAMWRGTEENSETAAVAMIYDKGRQVARPSFMDPDSHARNNPFAPEGETTVMEGVMEVKRVGGLERERQQQLAQQEKEERQRQRQEQRQKRQEGRQRWNPCLNTKYELERHDHEPRHGDVCRARGGMVGVYECPEGCHETAGQAPFCANDRGPKRGEGGPATVGMGGQACRVRDPDAPPEYRCDGDANHGVCIMAVGSPKEQFKGEGQYYDETCDGKCGDGRDAGRNGSAAAPSCASDWDCSLAGTCEPDGTCRCDPWAEGPDCSYLNFAPADKSRLGYLDEVHSSWGGSVVRTSDGEYRMFVSEIICDEGSAGRKRCGLDRWETHSRIALATSASVDGPYRRVDTLLHPEHHNPSVHVSPETGDWHLFSISGPTGPIVRTISSDEGRSWSVPMVISPRQNPGPLLKGDGSTLLFYRADGMDLPSPTCSDEGISVQLCPSEDTPCRPPDDVPIFDHTGEDPSVFVDHRGNHHMLFNALPYKCVPKLRQGGHAWSTDGVNWSAPRVGAFDATVAFTDGSSMTCERRERPQMVLDGEGKPAAMVSAVTGCPKALGDAKVGGDGRFYRGADDCFTMVQRMAR
ncbi:hypothetical protein ACHAWF_012651 [Thalassiosira exigua]